MKVIINAGHSQDGEHGACHNGLRECDVTYEVGTDVVCELLRRGHTAKLIQNDDMATICYQANASNADLFISLHCNAFKEASVGGTECYWYKGSAAEKCGIAIRQNICKALGTMERYNNNGNNLYVIKHTTMPAVLVEMFFISSKNDVARYKVYYKELVKAIADGIEVFKIGGGR